jgi:hypothetical protein
VDVWRALLVAHVKDRDGRCVACRWQTRPADPWPCDLYLLAVEARRLASMRPAPPLSRRHQVDAATVRGLPANGTYYVSS